MKMQSVADSIGHGLLRRTDQLFLHPSLPTLSLSNSFSRPSFYPRRGAVDRPFPPYLSLFFRSPFPSVLIACLLACSSPDFLSLCSILIAFTTAADVPRIEISL